MSQQLKAKMEAYFDAVAELQKRMELDLEITCAALLQLYRVCRDMEVEHAGPKPTQQQYASAMDAAEVAIRLAMD